MISIEKQTHVTSAQPKGWLSPEDAQRLQEKLTKVRAERDEFEVAYYQLLTKTNELCATANATAPKGDTKRMELMEQREKLRDLLFQARIWGIESRNFSATRAASLGEEVDRIANGGVL